MKLSGWGRFPVHETQLHAPRSEAALRDRLRQGPLIARGAGRAYGDSAVGAPATVDMRHFDRMLAFDGVTGQLVAEAGVRLADVISAFLPRGWFPAVTPGTKYVTLGGMIAADVHGKNHHKVGSAGRFIDWIDVMDADGDVRRCSPQQNPELFDWTIGGMGLTGVILRAATRLTPVETGWIRQTLAPAADLQAAMEVFEAHSDATYSVAWIDCLATGPKLGRSLVMLGEHARLSDLPPADRADALSLFARKPLRVPFVAPGGLLNRWTVGAFNALYFANGQRKAGDSLVDWNSYFYPLDAFQDWNRIYGPKGFAQFQCVLPLESSAAGLRSLLMAIAQAGAGSFLAVLKRFGEQAGRFSFPMPGYTLALDFAVNPRTLALMNELDRIVLDHGGRFYLAKDSRMTAETLWRSDPRAQDFVDARAAAGQSGRFRSLQSDRLGL